MNKQLISLRGMNFSYYALNAVIMPFLPLYFANRGYTSVEIALMTNIGPFVAMFAQPMWGIISDRLHTVKHIIVFLWISTVLASIGLFFTSGFHAAFLFTLLLNFFFVPSSPLVDTMTIHSSNKAGVSYGSIRLWGSVGFSSVAVGAGSLIAAVGGIGNLHYIYLSLWVVPFLFLFALKDDREAKQRITIKAVGQLLGNRKYLAFLFMFCILMMPHRMHDSLFGLYIKNLGATDTMVGLSWTLAAIGEIPVFAWLGRNIRRFNELSLLAFVAVIYAVRWVAYGIVQDPWMLVIMQLSAAITFGVAWIAAINYTVRLVPEELRSTGLSVFSAVFVGLAGIAGSTLGGWVRDEWGGAAMYNGAAIFALASAAMLFAAYVSERRRTV